MGNGNEIQTNDIRDAIDTEADDKLAPELWMAKQY